MTVAVVVDARCTACGICVATCPERVLLRAPKRPVAVAARCTACLECVEVCPVDALTVVPATVVPAGDRS